MWHAGADRRKPVSRDAFASRLAREHSPMRLARTAGDPVSFGSATPLLPSPPKGPRIASPARKSDFVARKMQTLMAAWEYFAELCRSEEQSWSAGPPPKYALALTKDGAVEWAVASDDQGQPGAASPVAPLSALALPSLKTKSPKQTPDSAPMDSPDGSVAAGKAVKDALKDSEARQRRLAVELERTKQLWQNASRAAKDLATKRVKDAMKGEIDTQANKIKELVFLTEKCGDRLREQDSVMDDLRAQVQELTEALCHERVVYHESRRVAEELTARCDELACENQRLIRRLRGGDSEGSPRSPRSTGGGHSSGRGGTPTASPSARGSSRMSLRGADATPAVDTDDEQEVPPHRSLEPSLPCHEDANTPPPHLVRDRPYLRGRGKHPDVPIPLRTVRPRIRNLFISAAVLADIVDDIWAARYRLVVPTAMLPEYVGTAVVGGRPAHHIALRLSIPIERYAYVDYANAPLVKSRLPPFQVFFRDYVQERWPNALEWAYSIVDACERHRHMTDFETFLDVFNGSMPEDTYVDYLVMVHKFRHTLSETLIADGDLEEWVGRDAYPADTEAGDLMPIDYFMREVESFFVNKTLEQLEELRASVVRDLQASSGDVGEVDGSTFLRWAVLFPADGMSSFLTTLQVQHYDDIHSFGTAITQQVHLAADGAPSLTLECLRRKMLQIDPHHPPAMLNRWLNLLVGRVPIDEVLHPQQPQPAATILSATRRVLIRRYGRLHTCFVDAEASHPSH